MRVFNSLAPNAAKRVIPGGPQIGSNTGVNRLSSSKSSNANDECLVTDDCLVFRKLTSLRSLHWRHRHPSRPQQYLLLILSRAHELLEHSLAPVDVGSWDTALPRLMSAGYSGAVYIRVQHTFTLSSCRPRHALIRSWKASPGSRVA